MEAENGTEMGGDVNVELKSQWRPSQSRKKSILNCLLMGNRGLYTKVKERSDQGDLIRKYRTSWKRVEYWREINSQE